MKTILIIGASSGPGRLLFEALRDQGADVTGIARSRRDVTSTNGSEQKARFIELDANDTDTLLTHIDEQTTLVHCSRPELLSALIATQPKLKRIIALGSTRVYTRFPDDKCSRVAAMVHALWMSDIPATVLHPTMIYGAPGLNNIERVVRIAKLSPFIPLPENGNALIQPIHADDVVRSVLACLENADTIGKTIILPGREAVPYRTFIEGCIELADTNCRVVSLPYFLISLLAPVTWIIPGVPGIEHDEIRRLLEDKAYDTTDICRLLGDEPLGLQEGLAQVTLLHPPTGAHT